ncbi:MAG: hypothetical protein AAF203_00480 [Pseudomonadota bacterium]
MKGLILVSLVLFSVQSYAKQFIKSGAFYGVTKRHSQLVENGDYYVHADMVHHKDDFAELGEVISEITKNADGLEEMDVEPIEVYGKTTTESVVDSLVSDDPYFCGALVEDYSFSGGDEKKCKKQLRKLLGDALEKADRVYWVNLEGDYYGYWNEVVIVAQDWDNKESLVLSFGMIYDI